MNTVTVSPKDLKNYVSNICRDITLSNWRPDYVVGITRGGLVPAVMISHYFNVPMKSLNVSLRDFENCTSDLEMAENAFGYNSESETRFNPSNSKNILLVDDINDSGATFNWIIKDWEASCLPTDTRWDQVWNHNVRFAVVVDNLASKCVVGMDYFGVEIDKSENDVWVEFPYENWWNL